MNKSRKLLAALVITALLMSLAVFSLPEKAYAESVPAKAKLPTNVELALYEKTLSPLTFDGFYTPERAEKIQIYLRTAAYNKYIKTVRKGSSAYYKYKKNRNYILKRVNKSSRYKVYKKIKAGKWKRIKTTAKITMADSWSYTEPLAYNTYYQVRVRGVNSAGAGKFSRMVKFKTPTKAKHKKLQSEYKVKFEALDPEDEYYIDLEYLQADYSQMIWIDTPSADED